MRHQSETYAPFPVVRRVDVKATIDIYDNDLQVSRYLDQSGSQNSSKYGKAFDIEQILDKSETPTHRFASLSRDGWLLDGKTDVLSGNADQTNMRAGVWISESDEDGSYTTAPYIKIQFDKIPDVAGWALIWDRDNGTYPTQISVSHGLVQDTPQIIDTKGYQQNIMFRPESASVQFEFLQTNVPNARPRLLGIIFGIREEFDKNSVKHVSVTYGADPACVSLPYSQVTLTIDNSDHRYNMLNPDGVYKFLQEGQPLKLQFLIDGEAVDMGTFGYVKATARDNALTAEIVAADLIYVLDSDMIDGSEVDATTLAGALNVILGKYGVQTDYPTELETRLIHMPPERISRREALRRVAQAVGCAVWCDRENVVRLRKLDVMETGVVQITKNEMYDYDGISVDERVDKIELTARDSAYENKVTYTFGEGTYTKSITNESIAPARVPEIAEWLFDTYRRRRRYAVKNRCDPAIEIGDTVRIEDAYGNNDNVVVTGIEITYDGGLSAITKGVGS
jgi:hypothetical protein